MAKKRQFLILAVVVVLLITAYVGIGQYKSWNEEKEKKREAENLSVTELSRDSVTGIRYSDSSNTLGFTKDDGTWYYDSDRQLPLKQSCAEEAVSGFSNIKATRRLAGAENGESYGFDAPSYTVELSDKEGQKTVIKIGDMTESGEDYYITADDGQTVFTVESSILDTLIFDKMSLVQTESFPDIDSSNLKEITIAQKKETLEHCSSKENKDELTTYGSELSGLSLDTCVTYNVKDSQLKQYGLDRSTRKEVTAVYQDSDSKEKKTLTFYMGTVFQEDETDYMYLQLAGSKLVYKVFVSDTEKLISF